MLVTVDVYRRTVCCSQASPVKPSVHSQIPVSESQLPRPLHSFASVVPVKVVAEVAARVVVARPAMRGWQPSTLHPPVLTVNKFWAPELASKTTLYEKAVTLEESSVTVTSLTTWLGRASKDSFNGACKSGPRGGDSVDGAGGPRGSVQVLEGEGKTIGSGCGARRERNLLLVVPLGSSLGEHSGQRIVALQAHTTRAVRSVVAGVATATLDLISIPSIATRQFREVFTGSVSGAVFRAGGAGASDTSVSVEAIALSCFAVARSLVRAL